MTELNNRKLFIILGPSGNDIISSLAEHAAGMQRTSLKLVTTESIETKLTPAEKKVLLPSRVKNNTLKFNIRGLEHMEHPSNSFWMLKGEVVIGSFAAIHAEIHTPDLHSNMEEATLYLGEQKIEGN